MKLGRQVFLQVSFLLLITANCFAQKKNITGIWEGSFFDGQDLQLNITQQGDEICGFTYDFVRKSPRNFCKAHYVGRYENGVVAIRGTGFIQSGGNHSLMDLKFLVLLKEGELIMQGMVNLRSSGFDAIFSKGTGEVVILRRVSLKPNKIPGTVKPCFTGREEDLIKDENLEIPDPEYVPPTPSKPEPKKPEPRKPEPKKDPEPVPPPITKKDSEPQPEPVIIPLPERIQQRSQVEFSRLKVDVKDITLRLYDNGEVDGDMVSVFYNGKLLVDKQTLSTKPIKIDLRLDDNTKLHTITLFAENLGTLPPNTALIVVTAGKKRYELRSSADLDKNAVLVFEYEPQ